MKGALPNQQKHSAALREGIEKIEQRLEEADGKIQNLKERLLSVLDEAAAARAETKFAQEATRAAAKRAEEDILESKEKDANIAALERRLKVYSGNSHQPPPKIGQYHQRNRQGESLRTSNERKAGGQPEHCGAHLKPIKPKDQPYSQERHPVGACTGCGTDLGGAPIQKEIVRQICDILVL